MKKSLLFSLAVGVGLSASAQSGLTAKKVGNVISSKQNAVYPSPGELAPGGTSVAAKATIKKTGTVKTMGVSYVDVGLAPNTFTAVGHPKQQVWADPNLKTVNFIHRSCNKLYTMDGGTGAYRQDYSTDMGISWDVDNGAFYVNGSGSLPARYPQAVVYNPSNGTDPKNAKLAYRGNTLLSNGTQFSGLIWGTLDSLDGNVSTGGAQLSPYTATPGLIGDGMTITKGGTVWAVEQVVDPASGTKYTFTNEIAIYKGVYNTGTKVFDYTLNKIPAKFVVDNGGAYVNGGSFKIAFSDDGMIGYIVTTGHTDLVQIPDSVQYITVYKTTDGGATWSDPIGVNMNADAVAAGATWHKEVTGYDTAYVTPWFSTDAVVDKNNDLHIVTNGMYALDGFALTLQDQTYSIIHVYSQGSAWKGEVVARPQTMYNWFAKDNNSVGTTADVRNQATINWAGDKIMFTWYESDSTKFPHKPGDAHHTNAFPNMWGRGLDLTTGKWTAATKFTDADPNQGISAINFAVASHYSLDSADFHMIPVVFANLYGDTGATGMAGGDPAAPPGQVQFSYVYGAGFKDADFSQTAPTAYPFTPIYIGINENASASIANVSNCFPNPFSKTATIQVKLNKTAEVVLEVRNTLGQLMSFSKQNLTAGTNDLTIDGSTLTPGIYFYTVKADDFKVTKKMIVKQ